MNPRYKIGDTIKWNNRYSITAEIINIDYKHYEYLIKFIDHYIKVQNNRKYIYSIEELERYTFKINYIDYNQYWAKLNE